MKGADSYLTTLSKSYNLLVYFKQCHTYERVPPTEGKVLAFTNINTNKYILNSQVICYTLQELGNYNSNFPNSTNNNSSLK